MQTERCYRSNCISNKQVTTFWASLFTPACFYYIFYTAFIAFQQDSIYNLEQRQETVYHKYTEFTHSGTCRFPSVSFGAQTRSPGMMIPEQRPAASQNSMFSPREWQPSQESGKNLTNFSMSPLSKRAVKSLHPSRLAEVCHAVEMEGGKEGGE